MITRASPRHLRLVPSPAHPDAAQREFPVRFTLARRPFSWLRRPPNGFGWVGGGTLRLESQGVRVTGRHLTLLGLRRLQYLIRPDEIRDVYREGNVVQINLRTGPRRPMLRFWLADVAQAAELVARLPTHRTIELEARLRSPESRRGSLRPAFGLLALAAAVLIALTWLRSARIGPVPTWVPPYTGTPRAAAPADALQRAVAGTTDAEMLQSRTDLEKFSGRFDALATQFATALSALTAGALSQPEFADGLDRWLQPQWATLARQLPSASPGAAPETLRARIDSELRAVIAGWQRALTLYAHGLRAQDPREVNRAFEAMRGADEHQRHAWQLLRDLEPEQRDVTDQP